MTLLFKIENFTSLLLELFWLISMWEMRGTAKRGRGRGAATRRKAAATSSEIDVTKETSADDKVITGKLAVFYYQLAAK